MKREDQGNVWLIGILLALIVCMLVWLPRRGAVMRKEFTPTHMEHHDAVFHPARTVTVLIGRVPMPQVQDAYTTPAWDEQIPDQFFVYLSDKNPKGIPVDAVTYGRAETGDWWGGWLKPGLVKP